MLARALACFTMQNDVYTPKHKPANNNAHAVRSDGEREGMRSMLCCAAFGHSEAASEEEYMLIVAHTRVIWRLLPFFLFRLDAADAIFLNMGLTIDGLD